ncbi:LysR family transcriptional regulator [Luteolibacter pohnpeiensis]|uniref:LysR family transcriptional regulator n=1 Tax=Luteolibacter pohnpeiensis TaxID=454153 RepID=A0A934SE59_9BACT|nr:LysR family transcriptional regulator [Luteolibacter pohnpeiensis]MBK1884472.1 LysR family transcriptional regulator [Luteolibacter pohnpeiensis]
MREADQSSTTGVSPFAGITFRQLEVFRLLCVERSYASVAVERRTNRAAIKRICRDLEKAVGRKLFEETADRQLVPTHFAEGLLIEAGTLYRSLRRMHEGVRAIHQSGRTLRFAAASGFFKGGLFTEFLSKLDLNGHFQSSFLRIETNRYKSALLSAECDVYFGAALEISERLDSVDLGPIPWRIRHGSHPPKSPEELRGSNWSIVDAGEPGTAAEVLDQFHQAGATGGSVISLEEAKEIELKEGSEAKNHMIFYPDHDGGKNAKMELGDPIWPAYRLSAMLRRNHPYSELKQMLITAANGGRTNGH